MPGLGRSRFVFAFAEQISRNAGMMIVEVVQGRRRSEEGQVDITNCCTKQAKARIADAKMVKQM